ncbi:hypothetical protein Pla22_20230 [Rubripirellula amarantea]|uniref:Uncharacterized protein n=1 Tax=Rubripirellula amarantea TaxID=2527999 RepID=A0A5C5WUQ2_9BACT|nr:hypothetical protein Pla22_20230 [Rubripirellula amarantea]
MRAAKFVRITVSKAGYSGRTRKSETSDRGGTCGELLKIDPGHPITPKELATTVRARSKEMIASAVFRTTMAGDGRVHPRLTRKFREWFPTVSP